MPARVHLRLRFQNLGKPRTAGLCGRAVGACDCGPLSCFLFRPRKSREKCRKRSHTNVSNASVTRASRVSQTLLHPPSLLPSMGITHQKGLGTIVYKTAHVCFRGRKWIHTRLSEKDRTQGLTRRNRGRFGRGRYHYPRHKPHVHEHPRAGYQNGVLCRFGILAGRCSRRTQKAFGTAMRLCVSLSRRRRGPAGLRDLFAIW